MNLIITSRCNKGCSFCFASEYKAEQEMTLETFVKLLDWLVAGREKTGRNYSVKLLGGEPTLHPQFVEFIEELVKRKIKFTVISNFLYRDPRITQAMLSAAQAKWLQGFLVNCAELQDKPKMLEILQTNYRQFLPLAKKDLDFGLACSVTLNRHKDNEAQYIDWLTDTLEVHRLRLSHDFQGSNQQDNFFINNRRQGEKISQIMDICLRKKITMNWDCMIFPCIFEDEFFFRKKVQPFISSTRTFCAHYEAPFDVFADLSFVHCYPAAQLRGENLLQYENIDQARRELAFRKKYLLQCRQLSADCLQCSYYQKKSCLGPCLGCVPISDSLSLIKCRS